MPQLGKQPERRLSGIDRSRGMLLHPPFRYLFTETPYRERHQNVKSWGCGGKASAGYANTQASFLLPGGRALIMHRSHMPQTTHPTSRGEAASIPASSASVTHKSCERD